jgi:hypothetical protein
MNADVQSRFLSNIFKFIQSLPKETECGMIDSVSLRDHTIYNSSAGKFDGFIDYGDICGQTDGKPATEALVLLVMPYRGS